jgi:hypothetical protein
MSNSFARRATVSNSMKTGANGSVTLGSKRNVRGQMGTSDAFVELSPEANKVTSCPSSTNASVR